MITDKNLIPFLAGTTLLLTVGFLLIWIAVEIALSNNPSKDSAILLGLCGGLCFIGGIGIALYVTFKEDSEHNHNNRRDF
jgi:uncharacterized membrane protein